MTIFFKLQEVLEYRHRSRSSHFRDIKDGLCTKPVKMGPKSVAWLVDELEQIRAARIAGLPDRDIKELVQRLHKERLTGYHCKTGGVK